MALTQQLVLSCHLGVAVEIEHEAVGVIVERLILAPVKAEAGKAPDGQWGEGEKEGNQGNKQEKSIVNGKMKSSQKDNPSKKRQMKWQRQDPPQGGIKRHQHQLGGNCQLLESFMKRLSHGLLILLFFTSFAQAQLRELSRQATDEGLEIHAELALIGPLLAATVELPFASELLAVSAPYELDGRRLRIMLELAPFEEGRVEISYRIIRLNAARFEELWQAISEGLGLIALPCQGRLRCGFFRGDPEALKARWEQAIPDGGSWFEVGRGSWLRRWQLGLSRLELRLNQQWLPELGDGVALALVWLAEE